MVDRGRRRVLAFMAALTAATVGGGLGLDWLASQDPNRKTKETKRYRLNDSFGVRADTPAVLPLVTRLGARGMRTWTPHEAITNPMADINETLWAAEKKEMKMLVCVAPVDKPTREVTTKALTTLLRAHPNVILELTNEYDDPVVERTRNRDVRTAAEFIGEGIEIVRGVNPKTEIVVGAQVYPEVNCERLVYEMGVLGVPIGELTYGVHAYQKASDVGNKIEAVLRVLDQYKIPPRLCISELGATKEFQDNLPEMIMTAYGSNRGNPTSVYLHLGTGEDEFALRPEMIPLIRQVAVANNAV